MGANFGDQVVDPKTLDALGSGRACKSRSKVAALTLGHARAALAQFERGSHVFGVNKGQFSMVDLVLAVLEKTGPADLTVWTWALAEYELSIVTAFIDSERIKRFRMVIDWAGMRRDLPYIGALQQRYGLDCIRVTKNHAKVTTIATDCGWRVTLRGSMNLNKNPRLEQFDVSDDPAVFDVMAGLEAELWERGRPLPVQKLEHRDAVDLLKGTGGADTGGGMWEPKSKKSWF